MINFFVVFIGLFMGMLVIRLSILDVVYFSHWKEKIVNYIILPSSISFVYVTFISNSIIETEWNLHLVFGFIIGFVLQFIIFLVRRKYLRLLIMERIKREKRK
ncbi:MULTISPECIES: hypothetical protein [Bacillus]|uniref:hypothetical protein n=1 Tax=Bacillus TaxID=1386 RepID=UPI000BB76175|nr:MULTISPECIES: hypothetical protein [Bacillus]